MNPARFARVWLEIVKNRVICPFKCLHFSTNYPCMTGFSRQLLQALLFLAPFGGLAQSVNASLNEDYYHWIDRYEVKTGRVMPQLFTSVKPYKRQAIVALIDSLKKQDGIFSSVADQYNYNYLRNDNWEWSQAESSEAAKPFFKKLYRKKSDLAHVSLPEFDLHVSPVLKVVFVIGNAVDRLCG